MDSLCGALVIAFLLGILLPDAAHAGDGPEPALADVLARAARYVVAYEQELANVVGEESYEQTQVDRAWAGEMPPPGLKPKRLRLESDYLLIRIDGFASHLGFRDVYAVDGAPVRDREERFTRLLELGPPGDRWRALAEESARYNLGMVYRNVNVPTFALAVLRPESQPRFRFTREGRRSAEGLKGWVIGFEEVSGPSLIQDGKGGPLLARGEVVVEPLTGRVLQTELVTEEPAVRMSIAVRYRPDPGLGMWLPAEMDERFVLAGGNRIDGRARYSKFRRFAVEVETGFGRPVN